MRAVCQRVSRARVTVDGQTVGEIGTGWAILLGVGPDDDESVAAKLVDKIATLRTFEDAAGRMNLAAADVGAEFLVVSQFTLYADLRGRRPGFSRAAPPAVASGRFGALMDVELTNHGPVTIVISTDAWT